MVSGGFESGHRDSQASRRSLKQEGSSEFVIVELIEKVDPAIEMIWLNDKPKS